MSAAGGIKERREKASFCPDRPTGEGIQDERGNRQLTADSTNHNALQLREMPPTSQENRKQTSQTDSAGSHALQRKGSRPAGSFGADAAPLKAQVSGAASD